MKPIEWQAERIHDFFSPKRISLLGVVMIDIAAAFFPYYFFSGEKFGVYWMSQLALLFAGILCVFEGYIAQQQEEKE